MTRYLLLLLALSAGTAQADICAQTGVFVCDDFNDPLTLEGNLYAGNSMPVVEDGLLKFTIPSQSGANAGGTYMIQNFANPIGEGESLYMAYRMRASAGAISNTWPTRKHFVLWRGSSSCTDLELVNSYRWGNAPWLQVNHACGQQTFNIPHESNPHNQIFQYAEGEGAHRCTHTSTNVGDGQDCAFTSADVWEDFYIAITVGTYGVADSSITVWQKKSAEGTWRKYLEQPAATIYGSGTGYGNIQLTVYMTGKNAAEVHDPAYVDYDYLVMSTSPLNTETLDAHPYPGAVAPPAAQGRSAQRAKVCFAGACVWVVNPAPTSDVPAWVAAMTPGQWEEISLNTMDDVDPENETPLNPNHPESAPWRGGSGQDCVINCWNGGAMATGYGTHGALLTFGGGHNGYYGSEVYAFDLGTQLWERVTDPLADVVTFDAALGRYPNGSPLPAHTYGSVGYVAATNEFFVGRAVNSNSAETLGANVPRIYFLDLDTGTWRNTAAYPTVNMHGGSMTYDAERNRIYGIPSYNHPLLVYDLTADSFSTHAMSGIGIDTNVAIDPNHDLILFTNFRACGGSCLIRVRDALDLNAATTTVIQNGTPPPYFGAMGFEWSNNHQGFLYSYNAHVYLLTKDNPASRADLNYTWSQLSSGTVNPPRGVNGVYNRVRVVEYGDETIVTAVHYSAGPVWGMRL